MDGSIKAISLCQLYRLWACVCARQREKKKERCSRSSQREIQLPICIATSPQGHQKQIRCRSKWPREIVSWNSREQSHDLSAGRAGVGRRATEADTDLHCWEFNLRLRLIKLLQIYTPPIQFVCRRSSGCKTGLTYCNTNPICSFSATRANRSITQSASSLRMVVS